MSTVNEQAEFPASREGNPRVWLLLGHKAGDNTQLMALGDALGWPCEQKRIRYHWWELLTNRLLGVTLAGMDARQSSPLEAPWPDLVLTAGRRNEPVARWIRQQSGGHTRLVHIGRPWAPLDCFDLIVTTPQYFVPQRPNVLYVDLPLHRVSRRGLDELAAQHAETFEGLRRPYWSVLLGGDSGPFVFTNDKAVRLADWLNRVVKASGGSLLITDSSRTPAAGYERLLSRLDVPCRAYHWRRGDLDNPYFTYLAVADHLVVTGESMSMLAEAGAACKPLYIFDLSDCPHGFDANGQRCRPWWSWRHNFSYKPLTHRIAMRIAPLRMRRDISRIQEQLVQSGGAVWVGQEWRGAGGPVLEQELQQVASRVRALFDSGVLSGARAGH